MSDRELRLNYKILIDQYKLIAKREYPNIPEDMIEDAAIGSLIVCANGGVPSALLQAAAYDLGVAPYTSSILAFAYRIIK